MLGLIVATDLQGTIGVNNGLPWSKPADLKRFRQVTMGCSLIIGRNTWESIGRPLPGRQLHVVTRRPLGSVFDRVVAVSSFEEAVERSSAWDRVWVAGGEAIYQLALARTDLEVIDMTVIQEVVPLDAAKTVARFPGVPADFYLSTEVRNENDQTLTHRTYCRTLQ